MLATQIIIFPDAAADMKLFTDPAVTIDGKIRVNEQFQTGVEGVFALDAASVSTDPGQASAGFLLVAVLEQQGAAVAAALKNPKMADAVKEPVS